MIDPVIAAHGLSVRYGRHSALQRLDLTVAPGSVYALLGRNGAGKSSLVRCLMGQHKASGGRVELFGEDAWRRRRTNMRRVGYVPEVPNAPPRMTPGQLVRFCSRVDPRWDRADALSRLERLGIALDARFGRLSRGQQSQVQLALALAGRPDLLILDDPTLGLDAVARREVLRELVLHLADRGATVFLTTHDLAGVEAVADRVGVLHGGRLLIDEPIEELKHRFRRLTFRTGVAPHPLDALRPVTTARTGWGVEVVVGGGEQPPAGAEVAAMSLEEIFIALTAGKEAGP